MKLFLTSFADMMCANISHNNVIELCLLIMSIVTSAVLFLLMVGPTSTAIDSTFSVIDPTSSVIDLTSLVIDRTSSVIDLNSTVIVPSSSTALSSTIMTTSINMVTMTATPTNIVTSSSRTELTALHSTMIIQILMVITLNYIIV